MNVVLLLWRTRLRSTWRSAVVLVVVIARAEGGGEQRRQQGGRDLVADIGEKAGGPIPATRHSARVRDTSRKVDADKVPGIPGVGTLSPVWGNRSPQTATAWRSGRADF